MPEPAAAEYDARWGYREFDAERYERRRYGSFVRRLNLRMLERALARALVDVPANGLVLDAPCGTGIMGGFLRRSGFRVLGADISRAMLEVAHKRTVADARAVGHVRADIEAPPFRAGSIDAVLSSRFMMHLPPDARPRVMRTMAGVTNGPLVATFCHPYTLKSFVRAIRRMLGGSAKRSPRITRRQLADEAAAAGLRLERIVSVMPLLSEVWVVVLRTPPATS
jgi:SAM-dependent methyltransferase